VVFSQNHDQVGNRNLGDRLVEFASFDQLKLAAATTLLSPYIPLLFTGEEYGESARFQYFVSHEDPALIEAVRQGRKKEFARFDWNEDIPDPQSEAVFLRSKLNWDSHTSGQNRVLWLFYQELLRLRRETPSLALLDKNTMKVASFPNEKVLLVQRWNASRQVVVAFHFSATPAKLTLQIPPGRWQKELDSAEERWDGTGSQMPAILDSAGEIQSAFGPWVVLVFVSA
jgi:maltooligosyltrehalose trehalohydrolase